MEPFVALIAAISTVVSMAAVILRSYEQINEKRVEERSNRRIAEAESKVEREPEKIKPAWDLARVTLEAYFNRNLGQVTAIFWLCTSVMFIGFLIIAFGVILAMQSPEKPLPSIITGLAGVVTELIGATFLFVYRSTMQQAINYTKTLERINSVGMAMQILDTIPDDAEINSLKNSTKASVVKMLMKQSFHLEDEQVDKQDLKKGNNSETEIKD
jgi:nitrate reductase gamma subunit